MSSHGATVLASSPLRDTQPRRLVLDAMHKLGKPASQRDMYEYIVRRGDTLSLVTVYRVVEALTEHHIIHKHPSTGGFILCSLYEEGGHHGLLSCEKCGKVEEYIDERLCSIENAIAKKKGFAPSSHLSEIIGTCKKCHS